MLIDIYIRIENVNVFTHYAQCDNQSNFEICICLCSFIGFKHKILSAYSFSWFYLIREFSKGGPHFTKCPGTLL